MEVVKNYPILHSTTKTGKTKYWTCLILKNGWGEYHTQAVFWQEGGVQQFSEPKFVYATNVGKANERSGLEQATFNAASLVANQQDKGYSGEGVEKLDIVLPMLANKWADKKHLITFPVFVQPKLDGVRMLMQDGKAWSRKGKAFPEGVLDHILCDTKGVILDGELIIAGHSFQDTMRAVKKYDSVLTPKLEYYVFDIVSEMPFESREYFLDLEVFSEINLPYIKQVYSTLVTSEEELMKMHVSYIQDGYEGTIIRTLDGKYDINHRSSGLLKMKDFDDAEFTIVGVEDGEGKDKGAAIFVCVTDYGDLFRVRIRGTMEFRRDIFENREDYKGNTLTVRYQGLSETGIPRFPVGISVRDYE